MLVECLLDYSSGKNTGHLRVSCSKHATSPRLPSPPLPSPPDCPGLGLMLYQSFPHLLNAHFIAHHEGLISLLVENSSKKPETVSLLDASEMLPVLLLFSSSLVSDTHRILCQYMIMGSVSRGAKSRNAINYTIMCGLQNWQPKVPRGKRF